MKHIFGILISVVVLICATTFADNATHLFPPRWVDAVFAGLGFAANPAGNPPTRTEVEGSTGIYGVGFSADDNGDFAIQLHHGLANTNAAFPDLYFNPHVHVSATATNSGNDVSFILRYQVAAVNSAYSSVVWKTNGVTFATTGNHKVISFGPITNNALAGINSVIFRGNLQCQTNDTGAAVILDSLDWHIPVDRYGSTGEFTD